MERLGAGDLWSAALGELQLQVPRPTFRTWLKETQGLGFHENALIVGVPTTFAAEWLEKRLYQLIQRIVQNIASSSLEVRFQVKGLQEGSTKNSPESPTALGTPGGSVTAEAGFNHKYSFTSFVVGSSNRLAHAAAQAVTESPGRSYNPLFIYAGVGLGKTHLLHAIGHELLRRGVRLLYVTSEQFTNQFISAIRDRKTEEFRARYRGVEALLIDDIQFISGKEQTQEAFFHTFNELQNARHQIVITCDRTPRALSLLEDRLRSRFEGGLITDIQPPDFETRAVILHTKAAELGVVLPPEVTDFIAKQVQRNVRVLEGCLNRLVAYSQLLASPISLELANKVLADLLVTPSRRSLTADKVIEAVENHLGISRESILGRRRDKNVVAARQITMYLLREEVGLSFPEIGQILGGKDHSTVMHAYRKIQTNLNANTNFRHELLSITDALLNQRKLLA